MRLIRFSDDSAKRKFEKTIPLKQHKTVVIEKTHHYNTFNKTSK